MATPRGRANWADRAWQWGPGFVILAALFFTGKPYLHMLVEAHVKFLDKTTENQVKAIENQRGQNEILSATQAVLNRVDTSTTRTGELIRDLHSRMVDRNRKVFGDGEAPASGPEIVSSPK